jgi:signal peptide peptidase SppA
MNLVSLQNRIVNGKWMLERRALYSFYDTVQNLSNIKVGGLQSLIFGNPLVAKMQDHPVQTSSGVSSAGDMAIIQVSGILTKSPGSMEAEMLGLCDTDEISMALDEAVNDASVRSIVMAFNSPGGDTVGIAELGRKIKDIDTNIKPIYAWTETGMNSAAYWLGSQARLIGMTESAAILSCGVYMIVLDASNKYKEEGVNPQVIAAESSPHKMIGHDMKPLTLEEKDYLQQDVNRQHQSFIDVVKESRPDIKDEALTGRSYEGREAFSMGAVDIVVDDFDSFLEEITDQQ